MICYVVMIQSFIDWMVDYHGHSRKDYFIAKIVRLEE